MRMVFAAGRIYELDGSRVWLSYDEMRLDLLKEWQEKWQLKKTAA